MLKVITMTAIGAAFGVAAGQGDRTFDETVRVYMDLRRTVAEPAQSTVTAIAPYATQQDFAVRIQSLRPKARQGDILGPVSAQLREIVRRETSGPQGVVRLSAVEETNVYGVYLRVNRRYPPALPRVTMPGSLLAKLPSLPSGLEYRFLGRSLVLLDADAGLVVDLIPDVLPSPQPRRVPAGS